ncbi:17538_t:CDS:2 [Funneliformis caledonium]|uniref:17538_t:CDS:1 n=1 Tax=Funneliformis caledonium TaxID=1117310 RepID=A0A9N8V294_9GLOM|nr:17538_t:CDS:2 [Funneliformis caledonium]
MDNEIQKDQKVEQGKALETEEMVVKTLPELADVSETIKSDKEVKREVGIVLNEDIADNDKIVKEIKEMESKKGSEDVSLEKRVIELDKNETDRDIRRDEKKKFSKEANESISEEADTKAMVNQDEDDLEEEKELLSSDRVQTLLQATSSTPSSIVTDVVESMTMPGFNNNVVNALHISFWLLFIVLIFLAVVTDHNYIVLINLGTSFMLYIGVIW